MAQGFLGNTANRIQLGGYTKPMMQGEVMSREEASRKAQLAEAMLQQRLGKPLQIEHWLQGLEHLAGVYGDVRRQDKAEEAEKAAREQYRTDITSIVESPDLFSAMMQARSPELQDQALQFKLASAIEAQKPQDMKWVEYASGDQTVAGWADPRTGSIKQVASAPRYKPSSGGGGGGSPDYLRLGNIVGPDNTPLGFGIFDKRTGQIGTLDAGGKFVPAPPGSREVPEGLGGGLNAKQFGELELEFLTQEQSLKRLNDYFGKIGDMNTGIARWADQVALKVNTLLSNPASAEQLATAISEGKLQGLLGLFRVEVVGPGVMTEYDAQRVIAALGGDITALQNPEVVKSLLSDIYRYKLERVGVLRDQYNRNASYFGLPGKEITAPSELGGTAPASQSGALPSGVPPAGERKAGQVYDTPRGKMRWTGTGWVPASAQ